ncbi:MAG: hypothetical protein SWH78_17730 [Thermodesulfobacteriota bacterium]|nr:hypothetical protein [Thermodesulfobacteriota bacterium]
MPGRIPPFNLLFERIFLEHYARLSSAQKRAVDKAVGLLATNPRHPSLNVHKAKNVKAKYAGGGSDVFIAYATRNLRFTFEYGPKAGSIALRNCGLHDKCEKKM